MGKRKKGEIGIFPLSVEPLKRVKTAHGTLDSPPVATLGFNTQDSESASVDELNLPSPAAPDKRFQVRSSYFGSPAN